MPIILQSDQNSKNMQIHADGYLSSLYHSDMELLNGASKSSRHCIPSTNRPTHYQKYFKIIEK
jgi:hypothetical protein